MTSEVRVFYDGGCPLCRMCVRRLRTRSAATRFALIDARRDPEQRRSLAARGFDLNEGIVVDTGDRCWSGADAAHTLASLHGGAGLADRLAVWMLGSRRRAGQFYPVFKAARRSLLFVLNRKLL